MNRLLLNIEDFAHNTPNNIALQGSSARSNKIVQLTYLQLWQEIKSTQQQLLSYDCQCIALRAENSIDWAIIDLAALLAQIPIIPIPMFFTEQQVTHILGTIGINTLIGDWKHLRNSASIPFSHLKGYKVSSAKNTAPLFSGTAKITFTSGSTGTPKGVCLSQSHLGDVTQSLINTINGENKPLRHLVLLPLSTLLENLTGIYVPLQMGLCSVIHPGEKVGLMGSSKFDPSVFCQALITNQAHSLVLTPALLQALIQIGARQPQLLKALKFVAVGGAHVSEKIMQQALALGIPAYEGYGLSECGSVVSLNSHLNTKLGSCGQALGHCKVEISDDGEILVTGASMLGYLGQKASSTVIKTGDLGYLDGHNYLHITGRKSNLLISSYGRNISPEWIESEAQAYPELQQIVVIGDAQPALTAVIDNPHINQPEILAAVKKLNSSLPDYAQIRTLIITRPFADHDQLVTANGRPIRANFHKTFTPIMQYSERQSATDTSSPPTITVISIKETTMRQSIDFFSVLQQATAKEQQAMYQSPIFSACQRGEISLHTYQAFLTQAYHHVKHTVPLLMACGSRLSEDYEWLRYALAQYIEEEKGHQEWILNDIKACGFDPEMVRNNKGVGKVGTAIELMVAYLYHQIDRKNPLAFLGMVWVLEGTSVNVGGKIAELVQHKLNLPDAAMTYLTSHSTLDQQHIKLFASLMNKITDKNDQQAIIEGANMVFKLYGKMLNDLSSPAIDQMKQTEVRHEA